MPLEPYEPKFSQKGPVHCITDRKTKSPCPTKDLIPWYGLVKDIVIRFFCQNTCVPQAICFSDESFSLYLSVNQTQNIQKTFSSQLVCSLAIPDYMLFSIFCILLVHKQIFFWFYVVSKGNDYSGNIYSLFDVLTTPGLLPHNDKDINQGRITWENLSSLQTEAPI